MTNLACGLALPSARSSTAPPTFDYVSTVSEDMTFKTTIIEEDINQPLVVVVSARPVAVLIHQLTGVALRNFLAKLGSL